ncbi:unnamed protein product, partial [Mesorhabditis spiculigera]
MPYPVDKGLRHAYKFTKVFEETRVLPDVEQFKPEPDSEGQALLSYWDQDDSCFYLIRCQYNFRRGRCLGSYERNQKSLEMIRGFMHKLQKQNDQIGENPAETTEKLKEECIKFNEYNKGATQLDLLTDSIWRPKGQRYSPWTMNDEKLFDIRPVYPMDARLRDAYKFTKTFEETGLLP